MFNLIPDKVDLDPQLSPNAKRLMGRIIGLNRSDIGCLAGNRYLADKIGVSIASISRYLAELKKSNYIEVSSIPRGTGKNTIRIIIPSRNILTTMEDTQKNLIKSYKKGEKNRLPKDIESDWLDDYIGNL